MRKRSENSCKAATPLSSALRHHACKSLANWSRELLVAARPGVHPDQARVGQGAGADATARVQTVPVGESIGDVAIDRADRRVFVIGLDAELGVVLRIVDTAGNAREFGPGEAGIIPAGFIGTFEVIERVEKRYVMLDRA